MLTTNSLRSQAPVILAIGSHPGIFQATLDFDFLSGREKPSIVAIIASGRRFERYFFGTKEVLIPVFSDIVSLPEHVKQQIQYFVNLSSARRVLATTQTVYTELPHVIGGVIFAENVPERHSLELGALAKKTNTAIIGPASVGLLLPGVLKLGAIGGVDSRQLTDAQLFTPGKVAVFSASGGMTNELINSVIQAGKRLSFALSFGGDRFPAFTPKDAFLAAQEDSETELIVYYGELGGSDEYELVELIRNGHVTKPVICYIGGTVSSLFPSAPQFGHAKAMAKTHAETAQAKREALREVGVKAAHSFTEFVRSIEEHAQDISYDTIDYSSQMQELEKRKKALIMTTVSGDHEGEVQVLGEELLSFARNTSFAGIVTALFLGRKAKSQETEQFVDFILRLLVDHGPYVSGAVNTIVTARAGRDLVSSLAAGLLTVGPRFGGAINEAAANWLEGASSGESPDTFVEQFAVKKKYILGIGHRKYRIDLPDPRVQEIITFTEQLEKKQFTSFALGVEKVTTAKKGNLILNVDGAIACVLLDMLHEKEGYSLDGLKKLTEIEFFNALFVLSRSVGFIAHFLDQKRLDEGLFRLEEHMVANVTREQD